MPIARGFGMKRALLSFVALLSTVSCGGGGGSPTEPSPGPSPATMLQGQTVNAVDGSPAAGLSVRIGNRFPVSTDGSGFFQVDVGNTNTYKAVIDGSAYVERDTQMTASQARTRVSMIPKSFDLAAFDEMFRTSNAQLQRWTQRPSLVILAAVMEYRGNGTTYPATGEQLSETELAQLTAHMTEGLALLTGNTFTSFASVEIERPSGGSRVNPLRPGQIVVGRYTGIPAFAKTIGFGQWSEQPDGSIFGGAMYLDRDFDRDDNRRRLLRIHELGHALGYQHVESRASIMNPSIGPEPSDFDRAGALIAFARPVGNKSPDIDPSSAVLAASTGEGRWMMPRTKCFD
jgi:hypothetical protein